jgi:ParB family chromosome partitioning protein
LSEHAYIWSARQKARGGAILTVEHDGKLVVFRGLIRPADVKAKPVTEEDASGETGEPSVPGLSSALANDLTAHRIAALRVLLADNVSVALAAVAHALALPLFYEGDDSAVALTAHSPALRAEGLEESIAAKSMADRHIAWQARLPETEAALWAWLLEQNSATVSGLIAHCIASTVKPVRDDRMAAALALDMTQWWQPSVTGYLGRVPKSLILETVTEGKGASAAGNIAAMKKGEMAECAAALLTGSGWLPPMLRAA